jgi:predicted nucleic-acid-binding protein
MIGLDSNVLLRAIANDDVKQSPKARNFLARLTEKEPGVINPIVLVEVCWSLRIRYKRSRHEILSAVENMLRSRAYKFTERRAVNRALVLCNELPLELPDALIGELNRKAGCKSTATFDKQARKSDLFSVVT